MHCRNHSFYWSRWLDEKHESNVKALPNHFVYLSFHTLFIKAFIAHEANARSWFCYSNDECNILHLLQRNICCLPSDDLNHMINLACLNGNVLFLLLVQTICKQGLTYNCYFLGLALFEASPYVSRPVCQSVPPSVRPSVPKVLILPDIGFFWFFATS